MTHGDSSLDCQQAADHLYELLDEELTPELERQVREHFENCSRCFPLYSFERGFKRFLTARRATRAAPEHLKRRIFDALLFERDHSQETS